MTLEEIFEPIRPELQLVQEQLRLQLQRLYEQQAPRHAQQTSVEQFLTHFFSIPGKGLRPALVLLSAKLAGPVNANEATYQPLIQLATVVELIHSASLIHDDVLDDALSRRNQVSLNEKYGNKIAILTGDILFLHGFSILINLPLPDWHKKHAIFQIICETAKKMCVGEIFQHQMIRQQQPAGRAEYLNIIECKTARLMSACCQCGALLTETETLTSQQLADFGFQFGMAFQLADDTHDQDAVLDNTVDLRPMTHTAVVRAKHILLALNGNSVTPHLMALCDLLLPTAKI